MATSEFSWAYAEVVLAINSLVRATPCDVVYPGKDVEGGWAALVQVTTKSPSESIATFGIF